MSTDAEPRKIRKSMSRGTPSYQLGHYEMQGEAGSRRSVFRVDIHLGEHVSADEALSAWPEEIRRLEAIGRENKAQKLRRKVERLRELIKGES